MRHSRSPASTSSPTLTATCRNLHTDHRGSCQSAAIPRTSYPSLLHAAAHICPLTNTSAHRRAVTALCWPEHRPDLIFESEIACTVSGGASGGGPHQPSTGALTLVSIFMALSTSSACPAFT